MPILSMTVRLLLALLLTAAAPVNGEAPPGTGEEAVGYSTLVDLAEALAVLRRPEAGPDGLVDHGAAAVAARRARLKALQARHAGIDVADWPRARQVDWLALRAQLDEHDFLLHVQQPWARDPGFYLDQVLRPTFTALPAPEGQREVLAGTLDRVPLLLAAATRNLEPALVPADFATLALFNIENADGVGHGHPFRAVPPVGILGWYEDLLGRARRHQPDLAPQVEAARDAVAGFRDWLAGQSTAMTARAGFGETLFDWYLRHVKYMPYSAREIERMGQRELDRVWAARTLERHRNRDLPELLPASGRDDYEARVAAVDADIRAFLHEQAILSIPAVVPGDFRQVGFNVPWIERPGGPNFWEYVQYRDPSPDHWHAVIPGHRFDALVLAGNRHPVRRHLRDGGRAEGWALYLEEAGLQLGFYERTGRPRTRELIWDFAIFRAARTVGDVRLQLNETDSRQVAAWWRSLTPNLDDDVARVDAEIYLRRPPGYGLGYTVGAFQMQKVLGERARQLGDDFVLGDFHDAFMAAGGIPIALFRYELTGLDDEVRGLWRRPPLADLLANREGAAGASTQPSAADLHSGG
ncbi:MAG: DUF885 family protein [Xanthomonadales bacterium]|nr:DUF885 family protein [Xanthomonadales bacterium]